jgi:hypothetical protein
MSNWSTRAARLATTALLSTFAAGGAGEAPTDATSTPTTTESRRVLPTMTTAPDATVIEATPNPSAPLPPRLSSDAPGCGSSSTPLLAAPLVLESVFGAVWAPDAGFVAYARADFVERHVPAT